MKIVKIWGLALLPLLWLAVLSPVAAQTPGSRFEKVSCETFELSKYAPNAVEGKDVACGYLLTPESHARPQGKIIKLAIVIIKSTGANSVPLLLAQGGPGGSSIELYAALAEPDNKIGQMLRADRDLIIFEQRGTLYAQPFLFCREVFDDMLATLDQRLSIDEENEHARQSFNACKTRLEAQGINLAAYNSLENAEDIATLAQVLGYEQLNFYGVSYGTVLGQHLLRLHPRLLRSITLDGIVPLSVNPNQQYLLTMNRSLGELFKACAANPDCQRYYPNLEQVFWETVEQLNQRPARIPVTDFQTWKTYNTVFDGNDLVSLTFQLLYASDAIPALPKLIYDARSGVFDLPQVVLPLLLVFERSQAGGMYTAVTCAEDLDFTPDQLALDGVYPKLAADEKKSMAAFMQICADWNVPQLGPSADEPVVSDVPALLYSGYFDPITPPANGDTIAHSLSHAYNYVFPVNGHGAFMDGECSARMLRDFLNNPNQSPDSACINDDPATPVFFTPANTLMSPGANYLMRWLNRLSASFSNPTELALTLIPPVMVTMVGLGLMIFPPVWFGGWVVNWLRHKPRDKRRLACLAPWLVGVLPVVTILFVASQLMASVGGFNLNATLFETVVGISRDYAWIFVLPWLMAFTVLIIVALAVVAWLKKYWGLWGRLYYSFTALLALVYALLLAAAGVLTVLFS